MHWSKDASFHLGVHQCDDDEEEDQDELLPRLAGLTIASAPPAIIWEPGSSLPGSTPEGNYYLIPRTGYSHAGRGFVLPSSFPPSAILSAKNA